MFDWSVIIATVTSSAAIVASASYVGREIVKHISSRELARHKADLRNAADREMLQLKAGIETVLAEQKSAAERELEKLRRTLSDEQTRQERLRLERLRWVNRVPDALESLEHRLGTILQDDGWTALSKKHEEDIPRDWSIRVDYFLPSTLFLFSQFFCWSRFIEEDLNPEIFPSAAARSLYLKHLGAASSVLSSFPLEGLEGAEGTDAQVFRLQQRAIGEALFVRDDYGARSKTYAEFLVCWRDSTFSVLLAPLEALIAGLTPGDEQRWNRLEMYRKAVTVALDESRKVLLSDSGDSC